MKILGGSDQNKEMKILGVTKMTQKGLDTITGTYFLRQISNLYVVSLQVTNAIPMKVHYRLSLAWQLPRYAPGDIAFFFNFSLPFPISNIGTSE